MRTICVHLLVLACISSYNWKIMAVEESVLLKSVDRFSDIKESVKSKTTEIHSSFNEDLNKPPSMNLDSSILQQLSIATELSDTVDELVLTLTGTSRTLDQENNTTDEIELELAEQRDVSGAGPSTSTETPNDVDSVLEPPDNATTDPTPTVRVAPEDIPSFSEWSQKQLAERKKADSNTTERVRTSKVRSKNYASPDCGAKIVAANPEAVSASSVISSSRDEYMLNHCTARIWFILELCEAVQAKQIDLANFELFSSSPREFTVYLGTRFPSRDWSIVGRFTAQDSRDVQAFDLEPQLFGKFLKLEVHSHYGKEHYCPLSWVRVYGTSEYEVLATEDERHGDDDDDLDDEETGDAPKNLFSSATDAVLSIVKKATAPFLKSGEQVEAIRAPPSLCVSPRYLTVCDNCSQHTYDNVFYILSCQQEALFKLILTEYVRWIILQTDTCLIYGLNFLSLREGAPFPLPNTPGNNNHYLTALLRESYIVALCNAMAVTENRVVVNMSLASPMRNVSVEPSPPPPAISILSATSTCDVPNYSTSTIQEKPARDKSQQIKPTRTLREEEAKRLDPLIGTSVHVEFITATVNTQPSSVIPSTESDNDPQSSSLQSNEPAKVSFVDTVEEEEGVSLDAILKDLTELEKVVSDQPATSASSTPPPGPPKDSIFLRLANRIKALELNMSLSSSYLEELSRRYRLQFELLGQTVNSTAMRLEQHVRLEELRNKRRDEEMARLREQLMEATQQLERVLKEHDSWLPRSYAIVCFVTGVIFLLLYIKRWNILPEEENSVIDPKPQAGQPKTPRRRNSVECVTGHVLPVRPLERRPSDEALEIAVSTNYSSSDRRKKKKRKDNSRKTSAVGAKRKKSDLNSPSVGNEENDSKYAVVRQMSEPPNVWEDDRRETMTVLAGARDVLTTSNRFAAFSSPDPPVRPPQLVRRFSSPAFMRTAVSSRVARTTTVPIQDDFSQLKYNKKESGFKKYIKKLF